jgi:hypothetical protein
VLVTLTVLAMILVPVLDWALGWALGRLIPDDR